MKRQSDVRRRRREVKELRADTYMVGLRVNHDENDGDCEVERIELRLPRGTSVAWQLDPDDNSTVVVRVHVEKR